MKSNESAPFALLSVSNKDGLVAFARGLVQAGYRLISTGGTATFLENAGLAVVRVSDVTGFPEIMDGRVKTLHPRIHGGLLGRRAVAADLAAMYEHGIADIRVVAVNLYPFVETVASGAPEAEIVEQIDIGGPAMVRASAKNFENVTVVVDPRDYPDVLDAIERGIDVETRRRLAAKAFAHTAEYDAHVASWFDPTTRRELRRTTATLRYGENPHQDAVLLASGPESFGGWEILQGKELSYNNLVDADAALQLVAEFDQPTCAIIKHTNPAGCASGTDLSAAFERALSCDSVSAFGGIVALNRTVDRALAQTLAASFWEVILATDFDPDALEILAAKKNLRLMRNPNPLHLPSTAVRDTCFGRLEQSADPRIEGAESLEWATEARADLIDALWFAWKVCKHVKSNAIVFATGEQTVGVGAGQMSRIDSVRIGAEKMRRAFPDGVCGPIVLASDAFFPFRDGIDAAAAAGVTAIIQPGGSKRDDEVIRACEEHGIAMALTGRRHFRH
ncbi:MAG: bifunctional phosphoribosylaminoimidazolecarboxamide formyltransferase/IMP cyclohydrolase [bacterium]